MTVEEWKKRIIVRIDDFVARMLVLPDVGPDLDVEEGLWDEWFE
jgi:hypothetical protein